MTPHREQPEPLKVAVLSSASGGGAGIAARRVVDALNLSDQVRADFIDILALGGRMPDDAVPPGNMSNRTISDTHFTVEFPGYVRGWLIDLLMQFDILNIHWASYLLGLSEIEELSLRGLPILFTCHDYYYFTGGCHYPATCTNFKTACVGCPQVNQDWCPRAVIASNLKLKKRIFSRANVHLSAPSAFLVNQAIDAEVICPEKGHVIRNPYTPIPGLSRLGRACPPKIVLMADSMAERRKAMRLAIESLGLAWHELKQNGQDRRPFLVEIIGSADALFTSAVACAGFDHVMRGRISDHTEIARILSHSDFLLSCSFEDNWPNVLVEAGAYGVVPIVGPGHGCEEFVVEFNTGFVSDRYDAPSFCSAIVQAIHENSDEWREPFSKAVSAVHAPARIAQRYISTIHSILSSGDPFPR